MTSAFKLYDNLFDNNPPFVIDIHLQYACNGQSEWYFHGFFPNYFSERDGRAPPIFDNLWIHSHRSSFNFIVCGQWGEAIDCWYRSDIVHARSVHDEVRRAQNERTKYSKQDISHRALSSLSTYCTWDCLTESILYHSQQEWNCLSVFVLYCYNSCTRKDM